MQRKTNSYEKRAKKQSLLGAITSDLNTKGDVKNSAIETVKDLVVGVIGGGVVGAAIGRASLAVGAVVTGVGHYTKSRLASIFGLGMMASNGFQKSSDGLSGTASPGVLGGVKDRVMTFKENFSQKLFLDKLLKSKKMNVSEDTVSGMGEVQYFVYPNSQDSDMASLERIEQQVAQSAEQFAQEQEVQGMLSGETEQEFDFSERLL